MTSIVRVANVNVRDVHAEEVPLDLSVFPQIINPPEHGVLEVVVAHHTGAPQEGHERESRLEIRGVVRVEPSFVDVEGVQVRVRNPCEEDQLVVLEDDVVAPRDRVECFPEVFQDGEQEPAAPGHDESLEVVTEDRESRVCEVELVAVEREMPQVLHAGEIPLEF